VGRASEQVALRPRLGTRTGWALHLDLPDERYRTMCTDADDVTGLPTADVMNLLNRVAIQGWRVLSVDEDKRVNQASSAPYRVRYLLEQRHASDLN
jgi:hypothetical protein